MINNSEWLLHENVSMFEFRCIQISYVSNKSIKITERTSWIINLWHSKWCSVNNNAFFCVIFETLLKSGGLGGVVFATSSHNNTVLGPIPAQTFLCEVLWFPPTVRNNTIYTNFSVCYKQYCVSRLYRNSEPHYLTCGSMWWKLW